VLAEFGGALTGTAAHMAEQPGAASSVFATPAAAPLLDPRQSSASQTKTSHHISASSLAATQTCRHRPVSTMESPASLRDRKRNWPQTDEKITQWQRHVCHNTLPSQLTMASPTEYAPRTHPRSTHHARTRGVRTTHAPTEYAPRTHPHSRTRGAARVSPRD